MMNSIALAGEAAEKLNYTTMGLTEFCETHEKFATCEDNIDFCKALDLIIFMCKDCGWWKPQRENATPNASEWQCQECHDEK